MNNNGFAMMRYFRDLGFDAHLLLYSDDGKGSLEHFKPENDTFNIEKWNDFIHQTSIQNSPFHVPPQMIQQLFMIFYNLRNRLVGSKVRLKPLKNREIKNTIDSYDKIITSGYGPAILFRIDRYVTLFSPYASGIEGVSRMYAPDFKNFLSRLLFEYCRNRQINSLKRSKQIVTAELGITKDELKRHGLRYTTLAMPMVYPLERIMDSCIEDKIQKVANKIIECDFSILMHSRLAWNKNVCQLNRVRSKNNHWVIHSFKKFIKARPHLNAQLIILEYGPDIDNTKQLVTELDLDSNVIWLKKTSRKNLMWLLQKVTVGVGEFIESPRTIWGGTGWEVLASGKPLIQGFHFFDEEFEQSVGYKPPPILPVKNENDILDHLLDMCDNPQKAQKIGEEARVWFHQYNGMSLSKKWLDLVQRN